MPVYIAKEKKKIEFSHPLSLSPLLYTMKRVQQYYINKMNVLKRQNEVLTRDKDVFKEQRDNYKKQKDEYQKQRDEYEQQRNEYEKQLVEKEQQVRSFKDQLNRGKVNRTRCACLSLFLLI